MTAKKLLAALIAVVAIWAIPSAGQARNSGGHMKPEIRDAVMVTRDMLAPLRFSKQQVWYDALLEDPRHGVYKAGHMLMEFDRDSRGNIVLRQESNIKQVFYSVNMSQEIVSYEEVIDRETGRALQTSLEYEIKGRTYWLLNIKLPPESSVATKKTAFFDWNNNIIKIVYGDGPDQHVRQLPLERDALPSFSHVLFMFKLLGRQEEQVYGFKFFDISRERYNTVYLQYEGPRAKGIQKYSTVQDGWGEQHIHSFWFGPPSQEAPNGRFEKFIINPIVARYITFAPTTKEKALEPVTPFLD